MYYLMNYHNLLVLISNRLINIDTINLLLFYVKHCAESMR